MTDTPQMTDPRLKAAAQDLKDILSTLLLGSKMDRTTVDKVIYRIREHASWCKDQGIDFPPLTAVFLPSVGKIRLHPKELPKKNIEIIIVNLKREFGEDLPMEELVWAVAAAWPGFKPDGPLDLNPRSRKT